MLAIIGGNRSSCVFPGTHTVEGVDVSKGVGGCVKVVDFGNAESCAKLLRSRSRGLDVDDTNILVGEHAWLALGHRMWSTKECRRLTTLLLAYRKYGYSDVVLLTRRVEMINKLLRDAADVKFDFAV